MTMKVDYCQESKIYGEYIDTNAYDVCQEVKSILDMLRLKCLLDSDQCFDIKVILCELLQNAIKHGNDCDKSKKIRLDLSLKEDNKILSITVKDQGRGFNPRNVGISYALDCNTINMDESGRGLFIVNELCDFMEFNSVGNAITVLKKL